jgi:hypothetical protein
MCRSIRHWNSEASIMSGHRGARALDHSLSTRAEQPAAPRVVRSPAERVGTAERERAGALVSQAYVDGLLDAGELDDHLGRVYAAATVGELDAATAVLPAGWRADLERTERARQRNSERRGDWRRSLAAYASVMALLAAIWLVTAVISGAWYPWPVWPALGWGIPLLAGAPRVARARQRGLPRLSGYDA